LFYQAFSFPSHSFLPSSKSQVFANNFIADTSLQQICQKSFLKLTSPVQGRKFKALMHASFNKDDAGTDEITHPNPMEEIFPDENDLQEACRRRCQTEPGVVVAEVNLNHLLALYQLDRPDEEELIHPILVQQEMIIFSHSVAAAASEADLGGQGDQIQDSEDSSNSEVLWPLLKEINDLRPYVCWQVHDEHLNEPVHAYSPSSSPPKKRYAINALLS
jgi:hypothetical protein